MGGSEHLSMKAATKLLTVFLLQFCNLNLVAQLPGLLPAPQKALWGKGRFNLERAKIFVSPDLASREERSIARFVELVKLRCGKTLSVVCADDRNANLFEDIFLKNQ